MSSVSQVVNSSGDLAPLDLFGCRTNSPHMTNHPIPIHSQSASSDAACSEALTVQEVDQPVDSPRDGGPAMRDIQSPQADQQTQFQTMGPGDASLGKGKSAEAKLPSMRSKVPPNSPDRVALNRIAKVREQQGISERTMARRLGVEVKRYRQLEDPYCDLTLSQLNAIQQALEVPISDLLEERQGLSRPVEERAKLLKVMKTAVALREAKINARADRMAQMLCDQLVDLMPELAEVSGWPQFGARRGISAVGKALQQPIDTSNINYQE